MNFIRSGASSRIFMATELFAPDDRWSDAAAALTFADPFPAERAPADTEQSVDHFFAKQLAHEIGVVPDAL